VEYLDLETETRSSDQHGPAVRAQGLARLGLQTRQVEGDNAALVFELL
jgi:hypothetical protein